MGRPIKKKFFQAKGIVPVDVVGQTVVRVNVITTGSNYSSNTKLTFSAPEKGVTATGTPVISGGHITGVTMVNNGSGYINFPTVTLSSVGTGTGATFTVNMGPIPTPTAGSLQVSANIPLGRSGKLTAEIIKQEARSRYLVENTDGVGICSLTASDTLAPGQMNILATDSKGSQYWVMKLTAHKALLRRRSDGGTGYVFADNSYAQWNTTTATGNYVSLAAN